MFGPRQFVSQITVKKTTGSTADFIPGSCDYLLWYGNNKSQTSFYPIFELKRPGDEGATGYSRVELRTGERRPLRDPELGDPALLPDGSDVYAGDNITSQSLGREKGEGAASWFRVSVDGFEFTPGPKARWKTNEDGMARLKTSERLIGGDRSTLSYKRILSDFPVTPLANVWSDTVGQNQLGGEKLFIVQTALKIVERCLLMTTGPGELALDPTCGSGTTAYVAEQWGRRWITCDTSRVAPSLARQRLMTARFPYYQLRPIDTEDEQRNPNGTWLTDPTGAVSGKATFRCKRVPHITLKSIARNTAPDPIFEKHEPVLAARLKDLNAALKHVTLDLGQKLATKLVEKQKREGKKAVTDADRRRWELPKTEWREWEVPFDTDPDWPGPLQEALTVYRAAWRAKMDEVNGCIAASAEMEELVDKPEEVKGIVRVSGPFTVEGVRPEELSLGEEGLFDPSPNVFEEDEAPAVTDEQNVQAYLSKMIQHLRSDGVSFMDNTVRRFARLEALFDSTSGSVLHAEGTWEGAGDERRVAVTFGPQSGPVTALQVEEAIREARQYDELVVAGFSFDAEATAVVAEQTHPRLRIHQAFIRPDLNAAMDGLLKDTPRSQLFTVFGQPEITIENTSDGWVCTLEGVDIYNPLDNTVRSAGADKVAAWFLDSDFDGRCFCITQAFFPDQNAWEKIAKALGNSADPDAFAALKSTRSLPFPKGKYGRIAVKVIDPRGNEVMAIRKLE